MSPTAEFAHRSASKQTAPLVVIGSGIAGYTFIREYRKAAPERPILLITESDGSFYSKPQLSAALGSGKTPDQLVMKSAVTMAQDLNIEIRTKESVKSIHANDKTLELTSETLAYSTLVLAYGATPRTLDGLEEAIAVNQLQDYREFRRLLTHATGVSIIGTGLVGCEFAYDLAQSGHSVELWGAQDRILQSLLPERPSMAVEQALVQQGVTFVKGQHLEQRLFLEQARQSGRMLLSAVGLSVDLALATSAGLRSNRGIVVDAQLRTSDPHIFAIGDCAEVEGHMYQFIQPITAQARLLAKVLSNEHVFWQADNWPVTIKVPGSPCVYLPPKTAEGHWTCEGEGLNLKSLFIDRHGRLLGAVLIGDAVRSRAEIVAKLRMTTNE